MVEVLDSIGGVVSVKSELIIIQFTYIVQNVWQIHNSNSNLPIKLTKFLLVVGCRLSATIDRSVRLNTRESWLGFQVTPNTLTSCIAGAESLPGSEPDNPLAKSVLACRGWLFDRNFLRLKSP